MDLKLIDIIVACACIGMGTACLFFNIEVDKFDVAWFAFLAALNSLGPYAEGEDV